MDKSLAKQRERIAAKKEENIAAKKQSAKQAEKKRGEEKEAKKRVESAQGEESGEAQRLDKTNKVTVTASSWDELRRMIDQVVESDFGGAMMSAAERNLGQNFDFFL